MTDGSTEPPVQYEADGERSERWWAERLDGARPTTVLPEAAAGGEPLQTGELPIEITAAQLLVLREIARRNRTTLMCVLLTAHMLTLSTFSDETDVVAAVSCADPDAPELGQHAVGPLASLVPIRAELSQAGLEEDLQAVTTALRESLVHTRLPYDRMIASTGPSPDDGPGIVRSAICLILSPRTPDDNSGLAQSRAEAVIPKAGQTPFDLAITLAEDGPALRGALIYRTDLYTADLAAAVRDQFYAVIGRTAGPAAQCSPRPASVPAEPGSPAGELGRIKTLLALTRFAPGALVASDEHGTLDREAFEARVNSYAAALDGVGAKPRVGVCLGSTVEQAAALFATWRVGGQAVLLDPRHSRERRAAILARLPVDALFDRPSAADAEKADAGFTGFAGEPDDIAYVVHTSGTDGIPKAVAATYANLEYLLAILEAVDLPHPGQNPLGPAFDGWIWATLLPWISGRQVVFPKRGTGGITALVDGVESSVTLTPTMLAQLDPGQTPANVVCAGEPLSEPLARRFAGIRLINAYGPTEATVCASWADSARGEDVTTIGRPAPGATMRILDRRLRMVPAGAVGEIHIGGPGITDGYLNDAELTGRLFVPDPFGADGDRLYRTGDLAVVGADGLVRFLRRRDNQSKVAGVRIELDEVAAALIECAGVREAAAVVDDSTGNAEVLAAVVLDPESGLAQHWNQDVVLGHCDRLLPEARPACVVRVEAFPHSVAGKLDRAALGRLLAAATTRPAQPDQAPGTHQMPARVAQIWSRILKTEITDYDRTFFEYGGQSLAASRVIGTLRRELDRTVPTFTLFEHPTVNELAAWLQANP
ncbi:MAG TPA: AMP-binding protein [Actinocrinis sp.]